MLPISSESIRLTGCTGVTGPRMCDANLQRVYLRGESVLEQLDRCANNLPYPNLQMPPMAEPRNFATLPEEQYGQRSQ